MVKEIALFPLNLVAFPGEELNLHVFEPRYKQLINDCLHTKTTFGIPSYVLTKIEYGTEMEITEVTRVYDDGRMDIKTSGIRVFKVKDFENPWGSKLYGGGTVELIDDVDEPDSQLEKKIKGLCKTLFKWLQMNDVVSNLDNMELRDVIHKLGLKQEEEYQLLVMRSEVERQVFVIRHLESLIPALERAEKAKEKIRMNGHFKHFDPLNL